MYKDWTELGQSAKTYRMKPRHAVALALVGWYLMVPPVADRAFELSQPRLIEGSAPLSDWDIRRAYDTADECEKANWEMRKPAMDGILKKLRANEKSLKGESSTERIRRIDMARESSAKCIATDDPRLIGK
jgi:hypothetical protein